MSKVIEKQQQCYIKALEAHAKQEDKDNKKHIQHAMQHNAILIELMQAQQKKIEELMAKSQKLIETLAKSQEDNSNTAMREEGKSWVGKRNGTNIASIWYITKMKCALHWKETNTRD